LKYRLCIIVLGQRLQKGGGKLGRDPLLFGGKNARRREGASTADRRGSTKSLDGFWVRPVSSMLGRVVVLRKDQNFGGVNNVPHSPMGEGDWFSHKKRVECSSREEVFDGEPTAGLSSATSVPKDGGL